MLEMELQWDSVQRRQFPLRDGNDDEHAAERPRLPVGAGSLVSCQ